MNMYQFMHQYHILDGLERFFKTIPQNVNIYKSKQDDVKNCRDHPSTSVDGHCRFFDIIQFNFIIIYISWNVLRKPFETIQTP